MKPSWRSRTVAGAGVDAEHGAEVVLEPGLRVQRMGVEEDVQVAALARPDPDVVQVFGIDLAGEPADLARRSALERPGLARRPTDQRPISLAKTATAPVATTA